MQHPSDHRRLLARPNDGSSDEVDRDDIEAGAPESRKSSERSRAGKKFDQVIENLKSPYAPGARIAYDHARAVDRHRKSFDDPLLEVRLGFGFRVLIRIVERPGLGDD